MSNATSAGSRDDGPPLPGSHFPAEHVASDSCAPSPCSGAETSCLFSGVRRRSPPIDESSARCPTGTSGRARVRQMTALVRGLKSELGPQRSIRRIGRAKRTSSERWDSSSTPSPSSTPGTWDRAIKHVRHRGQSIDDHDLERRSSPLRTASGRLNEYRPCSSMCSDQGGQPPAALMNFPFRSYGKAGC